MLVHCSTQHPSEMQHLVAHALGLHVAPGAGRMPAHGRRLRRQGVAVGAVRLRRGDRGAAGCSARSSCALDRDDDFMVTGRRHCFYYEYEVGYDDDGRILGAEIDDGLARRLSRPTCRARSMTRAICHFDNAYWLPDVDDPRLLAARPTRRATPRSAASAGRRARSRSSTSSTTIARELGRDPLDVRARQLLRQRDASATSRRTARWSRTTSSTSWSAELEASSDYRARRAAIARLQRDEPGAEARHRADAGQVRHLVQRRRTSTRPARWSTSTPTARCWSTTAAPRWARA